MWWHGRAFPVCQIRGCRKWKPQTAQIGYNRVYSTNAPLNPIIFQLARIQGIRLQFHTLEKYHTGNHHNFAHFFTITDNLDGCNNPRCCTWITSGDQNIVIAALSIEFRVTFPTIVLPIVIESCFAMIVRKRMMAVLKAESRLVI